MSKDFKTVDWACTTNIYEVNVRQYSDEGTFNAFAGQLNRLRDMGVETLWFMPVTPIAVLNRKGTLGSYYSCSDYMAVNPEFGTLADFRRLVSKAHKLGFRIIIDWVANHTGWDHVWTKSNPEFFDRDEFGKFLPPFPDWEDVIHLNYQNAELRKAMVEAMKFWVNEADIDGFRCDMAHLVPLDFWKEARMELDAIKPLFWLAETEEPAYHEVFDASYAWELLHSMEKYWKHETDMNGIDAVLFNYNTLFPATALRLFFTSNHDENSHSGTEYERMGDAAPAFAVLCATWGGIPLVYSGQEVPLKDKRLDFFDKDAIPWTGEYAMAGFYKVLLELRKSSPALRSADKSVRTFRLETTQNSRVFAFLKKNGDHEVLVLLNLSGDAISGRIIGEVVIGHFKEVFSGITIDLTTERAFEMKPWEYAVYQKGQGD
jgi:glycosidase